MCYELEKQDFQRIIPLFKPLSSDPMLFSTLEGHQAGRVWVDDPKNPAGALTWSGMEYAYLGGISLQRTFLDQVGEIIEQTILPALEESEMDFISVFSYETELHSWLLNHFFSRRPTSYGVNIYTFNLRRHDENHPTDDLPDGFRLTLLDETLLSHPDNSGIREDIEFCWESLDRFFELGLGACMLEGKKAVSACYAIAYGSNGYHLNVWTLPEYRQRGFGIRTGHYFTTRSLEKGITPYWLNDLPNFASKKLAEKIGFDHTGDLYPVDIPVHPGPFHIGLARHFQHTLKDPREAVRLYETGFEFLDGNAAQHLDAARAYAIIDERKGMFDHIRAAMEKDPEIKASIKEDPLFKHISLDDE